MTTFSSNSSIVFEGRGARMWNDSVLPLTNMTGKHPQSQVPRLPVQFPVKAPLSLQILFYTDTDCQHCPQKSPCPTSIFSWELGSWKAGTQKILPVNWQSRKEDSLPFQHQDGQNSEQFKQSFLLIGFSRWKAKAGRLSEDSGFSHQMLCCLHEEGLVWFGVGNI